MAVRSTPKFARFTERVCGDADESLGEKRERALLGMGLSRCSVLRCRRPATVVQEVEPPTLNGQPPRREALLRRYEVCEEHNVDYFGKGRFLTTEQLERIRRDLVPVSIR